MSATLTVSPALALFDHVRSCTGATPKRIRVKLESVHDFLPQMGELDELDELLDSHGYHYENIQFHKGYLVLVGARRA